MRDELIKPYVDKWCRRAMSKPCTLMQISWMCNDVDMMFVAVAVGFGSAMSTTRQRYVFISNSSMKILLSIVF